MAILPVMACFALLSGAQAVSPAPDGCYPNYTTVEGCNALNFLTTGSGNTGVGWYSLFLNGAANYNTGVGAGTLVLNNGNSNTAVGTVALLLNTSGGQNTAIGTDTLVFNDSGAFNTAIGYFTLMNNTTGNENTATGVEALFSNTTGTENVALGILPLSSNTTGNNNTAIGNLALLNSVTTNDHVCVGRHAGDGITTVDNNIIIGHNSGVHPDPGFGQISDRCFIDNIHGAPVSAGFDPQVVIVDSAWKVGHVCPSRGPTRVDFHLNKASSPKPFPTPPSKRCLISRSRNWKPLSRS